MTATSTIFTAIQGMARGYLQRQRIHPGDHTDPESGLLVCGTCGKPRQAYKFFINPQEGDPDRKDPILVPVMCDCEKAEEQRRQEEEAARREMERIRELRSASLMDWKFQNATFQTFQEIPENRKILQICRRYADRFEELEKDNTGMLFLGDIGSGKSFAAACIANELLNRKVSVIMTSFVQLLMMIQNNPREETALLNRLNMARLIIFDDLGAERNTSYAIEKVYNIVDSRYRQRKPCIFTTNLSADTFQQESDIGYRRIYDRILEMCIPVRFPKAFWRRDPVRHEEARHILMED